jgi:hypothetical protein
MVLAVVRWEQRLQWVGGVVGQVRLRPHRRPLAASWRGENGERRCPVRFWNRFWNGGSEKKKKLQSQSRMDSVIQTEKGLQACHLHVQGCLLVKLSESQDEISCGPPRQICKEVYRLPFQLTISTYHYHLPFRLTIITYHHRFPFPLTISAYHFRLPFQLTIIAYHFRLPFQLTIPAYHFSLPSRLTVTFMTYHYGVPITITASRLPWSLTIIAYHHRLSITLDHS